MRTRTARRGMSAALIAAAGLTLAACQTDPSGSSAAGSTGPAASTPASGTSIGSSAGSSSGGQVTSPDTSPAPAAGASTAPAASSGGGGPQICTTNNLKVTSQNFDSGAGNTHFELNFHNGGSVPCTLTGFPGVSYHGGDGAQLGNAATRTSGTAVTRVTLIPGANAVADVQMPNGQSGFSASECKLTQVKFLGVFPPGLRDQFDVPLNQKECVGPSIHGLVTGPVHPVS
jgi:hypothetical protein